MKPTHTGIAVALALTIVLLFFIFPGFTVFDTASVPEGEVAGAAGAFDTTNIATTTTPMDETKLQAADTALGTGATAAPGDTVTVNYVGSLTDNTVFDASANHGTQGFTFTLGQGEVIRGWDEGIVGMRVGGRRHLIIPATYAYGNQANGPIPANSTLIFDVELLKVEKGR